MPRSGRDSLIVALDVPTVDTALKIVETLDNVSFFKVGLQLFLTGELPRLLKALRQKSLFVDLKVPGDIANTIGSVIDLCVTMEVRFLTLSESMPLSAIKGAKAARDKHGSKNPELLTVPFLSSLDRDDLRAMTGSDDITTHILARAGAALAAGCDGVVASGQEIRLCRTSFPDTIIVSPGIRPIGSSVDDHKRFTTPSEAIRLGADYLVVGRPILNSGTPRKVAEAIIDEIEQAREEKANLRSSSSAKPNQVFMPTSF
ncbi:MAG: orotidine-5'-phosphate decarboxylase [Terriglobales bacterium]